MATLDGLKKNSRDYKTPDGKIVIPFNKHKIFFLFLACLAASTGSALFAFFNPENTSFDMFAFLGGSFLFGAVAVLYCVKFFDGKPGLVIDKSGIMENSGFFSGGFFPWTAVEEISVFKYSILTAFVKVFLKNPRKYINKNPSFFKRIVNELTLLSQDTPVYITPSCLDIDFEYMHKLIDDAYKDYLRKNVFALRGKVQRSAFRTK